ncbi:2-iminoacetate synthase ThiH [Mangrovibacterium marinum]|uniref:Tyrosine lyase ThiH n=1 Tax=Mangrovibacterium marinum TaxID=1639118 RepID=A0A2T5BX41_9BACT|nr:2-iminoacetate synthase ThiH [Mangrovibacterium marinum]PTN04339.1 tyrosine lyase ThiH [Mangrovibacterium marinum]
MEFYELIQHYNWDSTRALIYSKNAADVEKALNKTERNIDDFMALISPAAAPSLEQMAQQSRELTLKRFGKTIQMYVPLYLSNECTNFCTYCGFNHNNEIDRCTLNKDQVLDEAKAIRDLGFEHLLLVTGEHPRKAGFAYLKEIVELLNPLFAQISIEVQPMQTEEYKALVDAGLHAVYVYQETYYEQRYPIYHPKGKKANFRYRLETPERLGKAGIHKTGLGCLLGLEDWRVDSFFTALHLQFLKKHYWKTKYSIAFPRLRPHAGSFNPDYPINDREFVQLICAYRLLDENVELSISTRESSAMRDNLAKLGVTTMSAGSSTKPGGYATKDESLEQFTINDDRTPDEVETALKAQGYEVVWKDWDVYMQHA